MRNALDRSYRDRFLKPTNHDRPTPLSPTANSIKVILTNHLYKPDLGHSTDNNFSLDSHDDFRSGCRKSVITVQKQSFSRTALTLTIKLHYYKVVTIAKDSGFREALSPRSTRIKANPRIIGTIFWSFDWLHSTKKLQNLGEKKDFCKFNHQHS